jgi:hypothetical protein
MKNVRHSTTNGEAVRNALGAGSAGHRRRG